MLPISRIGSLNAGMLSRIRRRTPMAMSSFGLGCRSTVFVFGFYRGGYVRRRVLVGLRSKTSLVLYADHPRWRDLFEAACQLGQPGYEPAATTWVKIKNRRYSEAEESRFLQFRGSARSALRACYRRGPTPSS